MRPSPWASGPAWPQGAPRSGSSPTRRRAPARGACVWPGGPGSARSPTWLSWGPRGASPRTRRGSLRPGAGLRPVGHRDRPAGLGAGRRVGCAWEVQAGGLGLSTTPTLGPGDSGAGAPLRLPHKPPCWSAGPQAAPGPTRPRSRSVRAAVPFRPSLPGRPWTLAHRTGPCTGPAVRPRLGAPGSPWVPAGRGAEHPILSGALCLGRPPLTSQTHTGLPVPTGFPVRQTPLRERQGGASPLQALLPQGWAGLAGSPPPLPSAPPPLLTVPLQPQTVPHLRPGPVLANGEGTSQPCLQRCPRGPSSCSWAWGALGNGGACSSPRAAPPAHPPTCLPIRGELLGGGAVSLFVSVPGARHTAGPHRHVWNGRRSQGPAAGKVEKGLSPPPQKHPRSHSRAFGLRSSSQGWSLARDGKEATQTRQVTGELLKGPPGQQGATAEPLGEPGAPDPSSPDRSTPRGRGSSLPPPSPWGPAPQGRDQLVSFDLTSGWNAILSLVLHGHELACSFEKMDIGGPGDRCPMRGVLQQGQHTCPNPEQRDADLPRASREPVPSGEVSAGWLR